MLQLPIAILLIKASLNVDYDLEFRSVQGFVADKDYFHEMVGWAYAVITLPPAMMVNA